jgi:hypothetical protein
MASTFLSSRLVLERIGQGRLGILNTYRLGLFVYRCSVIQCLDLKDALSIAALGSAWLAISLRMPTPMSQMRF